MTKNQKSGLSQNKGVMSKINDNPDKQKDKSTSDKKKGIISKMNDNPDQKK